MDDMSLKVWCFEMVRDTNPMDLHGLEKAKALYNEMNKNWKNKVVENESPTIDVGSAMLKLREQARKNKYNDLVQFLTDSIIAGYRDGVLFIKSDVRHDDTVKYWADDIKKFLRNNTGEKNLKLEIYYE